MRRLLFSTCLTYLSRGCYRFSCLSYGPSSNTQSSEERIDLPKSMQRCVCCRYVPPLASMFIEMRLIPLDWYVGGLVGRDLIDILRKMLDISARNVSVGDVVCGVKLSLGWPGVVVDLLLSTVVALLMLLISAAPLQQATDSATPCKINESHRWYYGRFEAGLNG